jgi:transposase-like protein
MDKSALCEDLGMILQASSRERAEEERALLEKHWGKKYPRLVTYLEGHFDAVLAVLNVPAGHRKRLRTTNHVERVNQELKHRGRTVRIWPNPASRDRLYGALLMEQHERTLDRHHLAEAVGGQLRSGSALGDFRHHLKSWHTDRRVVV